ncbi:MAG: ATP-binding cassette domain-containing protein, partial [Pseudomonadota bacterium]
MSGPAKMVGGLEAAIGLDRPFAMDAQIACAPGELMGLIGPSGSGKTTLLRALAGLVRPPRGRISVGARVWQDAEARTFLPPQARRVGLVFQDFALFPHLTARETVALAIDPEAYAGRSAQLQHAERWLTRVNLHGPRRRAGAGRQTKHPAS